MCTLLEGCTEFSIFRELQRNLMYFSFHFHIKPHLLMVKLFSFDILKPTGSLPFTNIFFCSLITMRIFLVFPQKFLRALVPYVHTVQLRIKNHCELSSNYRKRQQYCSSKYFCGYSHCICALPEHF